MRIWLDDIRPMQKGFDLHVKTYDEAINVLKSGNVQHISFDHDLGQGKTGYDVACWIESMAAKNKLKSLTWDIHSANPVGKGNIMAAMFAAERLWAMFAREE